DVGVGGTADAFLLLATDSGGVTRRGERAGGADSCIGQIVEGVDLWKKSPADGVQFTGPGSEKRTCCHRFGSNSPEWNKLGTLRVPGRINAVERISSHGRSSSGGGLSRLTRTGKISLG